MTLNRVFLVALPLCLSALVGCRSKPPEATETTDSAAPQASASAPTAPVATLLDASAISRRGLGLRAGPSTMLFTAARAQTLSDAQKVSLTKVEDDVRSAVSPRSEMKELQSAIAEGVKAGKIDPAHLAPRYDAFEKAAQTQADKEAEGLNGLYATLDDGQRKAVVADVRAKQEAREKRMATNDPAKKAEVQKQRLERFTRDLELDAAQQKTVDAALAKASKDAADTDPKKDMDALFAAFEKDGFDAKKLDSFTHAGKTARTPIEHDTQFIAQILSVLKPEQRVKLASKMDRPIGAARLGMDRTLSPPVE